MMTLTTTKRMNLSTFDWSGIDTTPMSEYERMGKTREDNQETVEPYVEKLDDKIKKLNSTRVYKKITPREISHGM